ETVVLEDRLGLPMMRKLIESLGNTWDGQHKLYDLLRNGKLKAEYHPIAVIKLMGSWSSEIRENAPKYLSTSTDRAAITDLMEREGDPKTGKSAYTTYCVTCHIADGEGIAFGPGLSDIGNILSRSFLYSSIIYPNAGTNFGYEGYTIQLRDGSLFSGYILSESEDEVTLKMMGATLKRIPKKDIDNMEAMDSSLMPEGLDRIMKEQELVDLVAYLETLRME